MKVWSVYKEPQGIVPYLGASDFRAYPPPPRKASTDKGVRYFWNTERVNCMADATFWPQDATSL